MQEITVKEQKCQVLFSYRSSPFACKCSQFGPVKEFFWVFNSLQNNKIFLVWFTLEVSPDDKLYVGQTMISFNPPG